MYQSLIHLAFTILTVAVAVRSEEQAPPCVSGVYMIVARGTNQPQTGPPDYGEGKQYTVAQMVKKQVNDSNDVDLVYPAIRPPYAKSEGTGVKHMINMIHQYANNCPNDKIVLMGYSQGAQVVADTLCGSVHDSGPYDTPPLADSFANNIAAVLLMGDPSHQVGMGWNANTSNAATSDGVVKRTHTKPCSKFYDRAISYCDKGDAFCQTGDVVQGVHGSYVAKYGSDAADFIVKQVT